MQSPDAWQLQHYRTIDGRVPFREWHASRTDHKAVVAIRARLRRIQRGLFGDCKPVGDGVLEFRVDLGPGYRGYFFRSGRQVILLLCGGSKRTQDRDIGVARAYRRDYEQRTRGTLGSG